MAKVAERRKHGNRWQVNYVGALGKRRYRTYATYKAAVIARRQLAAEADQARAAGTPAVERHRTYLELEQLWKDVKHRKRSHADDERHMKVHLRPAFERTRLDEITPQVIARFERDLSERISTGTVRLVLALLRSMLNLAEEHHCIGKAPKIRLPSADAQDYDWLASDDDIEAVLEAARGTGFAGLDVLYATAIWTGMRQGELCGLRWTDVSFERRLITVQRSFEQPTASNRVRHMPIVDRLLPMLQAWHVERANDGIVFPNEAGQMQWKRSRATSRTFYRCLQFATLQRIRFHDLRHTSAPGAERRGKLPAAEDPRAPEHADDAAVRAPGPRWSGGKLGGVRREIASGPRTLRCQRRR
ncbi:MAG: tyrosine-type recombinase/integrase [Alphaproteobacteria bacterium]|nr:tyrosine-type recombinase/integrase [Alphaproteobacteria bacterium]